jgi:hypothetical protein
MSNRQKTQERNYLPFPSLNVFFPLVFSNEWSILGKDDIKMLPSLKFIICSTLANFYNPNVQYFYGNKVIHYIKPFFRLIITLKKFVTASKVMLHINFHGKYHIMLPLEILFILFNIVYANTPIV